MTLDELEERTTYSYSYDRYSPTGWRGCILLLREKGLSDLEVEAVLGSQHMIFAADMSELPWGSNGRATLERYLDKHPLRPVTVHVLVQRSFSAYGAFAT